MKLPLDLMRRTIQNGEIRVCVESPIPYGLTICGEDMNADPAQPDDTINCPHCLQIIRLCKKVR